MQTHFWLEHRTEGRNPDLPDDRVYVRQYGSGAAVLLALHGFGRSGGRMERLGRHLGDQFTTLAPDLPYHGETEWYGSRYTSDELTSVLQQLLDRYADRPVFLLGHSLGGRYLSACLAGLRHPDLRDLALVAPDGAGGRYTNWIDTLPRAMVRPLAKLTERPRTILRASKWLTQRGILNTYSAEYLKYHLNDRSFRRRLAGTLRSVLAFPPRPAAFESALQQHEMHCSVFVGDKDPLLHHGRLTEVYEPLPSVDLVRYSGSHWLPERLLARYYRKNLVTALP
jgi:pimeloyl-ACP methyl ester carboxylesterase